jgi:hypothetical protein
MKNADLFRQDIDARIDYHRKENQLSYSEAIGVLSMILHGLQMEAYSAEQPDE